MDAESLNIENQTFLSVIHLAQRHGGPLFLTQILRSSIDNVILQAL
jgi:hypothetical protein